MRVSGGFGERGRSALDFALRGRSPSMITLTVNGKRHELDVEPDAPLLWVIRDEIGLTGTKFGCGIAQCGACTVHVDGKPVRSCVTPTGSVKGEVTTIEGLSSGLKHPVQQAWLIED